MAQPSPTHSGRQELVSLGQAVRELRLTKGWSQEAFADYAEIDRSYICRSSSRVGGCETLPATCVRSKDRPASVSSGHF